MVDVRRVKLPGVGVLHTFVTDDGGKVGVITHRSGNSDLITFADAEDGDARKVSLRLDEDEAHTLAELLGGTRISIEAWDRGVSAAPVAARLMGEALGWGSSRIAAETENYIARVEAERASQEQPDDAGADRVRLQVPDVESIH